MEIYKSERVNRINAERFREFSENIEEFIKSTERKLNEFMFHARKICSLLGFLELRFLWFFRSNFVNINLKPQRCGEFKHRISPRIGLLFGQLSCFKVAVDDDLKKIDTLFIERVSSVDARATRSRMTSRLRKVAKYLNLVICYYL